MSTAISELDTIDTIDTEVGGRSDGMVDDLGFDTVPRVRPAHRGGVRVLDSVHRPLADRRPRGARPRDGVVRYDGGPLRTPALRRSHGAHPMVQRVEQAQVGFAVLAAAALLSALVVVALIGLAHWRAGTFEQPAPTVAPVVVDAEAPGVLAPR